MIKVLIVLSLAALIVAQELDAEKRPIISTKGGDVQGSTLSCGLFCSFFGFRGIPYAEPPVGELRFRNPVAHRGWQGVRDGSKHGSTCLKKGTPIGVSGSEDCLFLNVYTPNLVGARPVIVYIHGGSFNGGSGDSWVYGPDVLIAENVLIVSVNYRIGILGFFSTGDSHAQGNWGMKDIIQALKWVKENIAAFGGDPNNVTIFGESAGAVSVHYILLSQMGRDLYHKAIASSGTALVPWGFQPNPKSAAAKLAIHFGFSNSSSEELLDKLRNLNARDFIGAQEDWLDLPIPRGLRPFEFVINVEPADSPEPTFLTKKPIEIMKAGTFNQVPLMIGNNDAESLFMIRELLVDSTVFKKFNANPHLLVPAAWNIEENSPASQAVSTAFQNFYWDGKQLSNDVKLEWTRYLTDHQFIYAVDKTVEMHSKRTNEPVFFYQFTYDGDLNGIKRLLLLTSYPGAVHGDDVFYLWSVTNIPVLPILPGNHARTVRSRMARLWTNFAKFSNPTPTSDSLLQNVKWSPVQGTQEYMNIGHDLQFGRWPNKERMALWKDLEERYAKNIYE